MDSPLPKSYKRLKEKSELAIVVFQKEKKRERLKIPVNFIGQ